MGPPPVNAPGVDGNAGATPRQPTRWWRVPDRRRGRGRRARRNRSHLKKPLRAGPLKAVWLIRLVGSRLDLTVASGAGIDAPWDLRQPTGGAVKAIRGHSACLESPTRRAARCCEMSQLRHGRRGLFGADHWPCKTLASLTQRDAVPASPRQRVSTPMRHAKLRGQRQPRERGMRLALLSAPPRRVRRYTRAAPQSARLIAPSA